MKIRELQIDGFGKFHNYHAEMSDGIQVIYGKNEAGKTTLRQFMIHMFFGMEKGRGIAARKDDYTKYVPINGGKYGGTMVVEHRGEIWRIVRDFSSESSKIRLFYEETMEEVKLQEATLQNVLFESSKEAFESTVSMTQSDIRTGKQMQEILRNSMANIACSKDTRMDIAKAVDYLKMKRRQLRKSPVFSENEQLRKQMMQSEFPEDIYRKLEQEEEKLRRRLDQKTSESFFQKIIRWLMRLFGIDEERTRKQEIRHRLEVISVEKNYLLKQKQAMEELEIHYQQNLEEKQRIEEEIHAVEQAIKAIETAASEVQKTFGEELNEMISEIFREMTGGKYEQVIMDDAMQMMVKQGFDYIEMKYLSNGTVEQLYFALRLATARLLYKEDDFPLFLDDVFGNYDDERIGRTLDYLANKNRRQIFLFTCRQETLQKLDDAGTNYHLIAL